jgi:hypothetical protein
MYICVAYLITFNRLLASRALVLLTFLNVIYKARLTNEVRNIFITRGGECMQAVLSPEAPKPPKTPNK